jgi:thiamine pyrophosphokinase
MSSHHFVVDNQEPALVLANGQPCSMDTLQQLMDWNPQIMVLDGAYHKAMERHIRFDFLSGDFDSIVQIPPSLPFPFEIFHTPDQNKTDLQKGLEILMQKGIYHAHILWATGGRLDHQMANLNVMAKLSDQMNLRMIDDYSNIYVIHSPFQKYFKANRNVSLIPMTTVTHVKTQNLLYNLTGQNLSPVEAISSSNKVATSGMVHIEFSEGVLLLMECDDVY